MEFEKCTIMSGFRRSGHILYMLLFSIKICAVVFNLIALWLGYHGNAHHSNTHF